MIPYLGDSVKSVPADFVKPEQRIYQNARKSLRDQLRRARRSAGLKQREVCDLMGRTPRFVSKIETGERQVGFIDLLMFARIYRKKLSYFSTPLDPLINSYFTAAAKSGASRPAPQ